MSANYNGIVVPLITPVDDREEVDKEGVKKLIEHVVGGGVQGVFPLGTTGEFVRLTGKQRQAVAEICVEAVAGRVPVYMGVSDAGARKVLRNIRAAERLGVNAVVCSLPYYYPVIDEEEQLLFYETVIGNTELPVMLYNIPATTGAAIHPGVVKRLAAEKNALGIKDSSGIISYLAGLLALDVRPDFRVFAGEEKLARKALFMGAHGLVPSLANVYPRLLVDLYEASLVKDEKKAGRIQSKIDEINEMNSWSPSWMGSLVWKKKLLRLLHICSDRLAEPYLKLTPGQERELELLVEKNGGFEY